MVNVNEEKTNETVTDAEKAATVEQNNKIDFTRYRLVRSIQLK